MSRIGVRLGMTPARAQRLLAAALASIPEQDIDELRFTSEIRLDRAAAAFGGLLDDPDPRIRLQAANGLVGAERDRSRLLGTSLARPKDPD